MSTVRSTCLAGPVALTAAIVLLGCGANNGAPTTPTLSAGCSDEFLTPNSPGIGCFGGSSPVPDCTAYFDPAALDPRPPGAPGFQPTFRLTIVTRAAVGGLTVTLNLGPDADGVPELFEGQGCTAIVDCPIDPKRLSCLVPVQVSPPPQPQRLLDVELIGDALVGVIEIEDGVFATIHAARL